ncbi:hypothetical protein pipiens_015230 [Culex pipiens pipiens]|uniref:Uncharacterized protein n=1 Tax=Culex pipiens pipiens TaxID=38569 RepID=A0ABD1CT98_CULPP
MNFLRSTSGEVVRPSSCQFLFRFETCLLFENLRRHTKTLPRFRPRNERLKRSQHRTILPFTARGNDSSLIRSFRYKLAAWPPR